MPLYEYECEACRQRFEKIQKYSDPPIDVCPHCGKGPVRKLLSSPAIQFKGSGWYITDYARKGSSEASTKASTSSSGDSTSGSSSDSKPADTSSSATPAKKTSGSSD